MRPPLLVALLLSLACSTSDNGPATYTFTRDGVNSVDVGEGRVVALLSDDIHELVALLRGAITSDMLDLLPPPADPSALTGPSATGVSCRSEVASLFTRFYRNGEDADMDGMPDTIDGITRVQAQLPDAPPIDPALRSYGAIAPGVSLAAWLPETTLVGLDTTALGAPTTTARSLGDLVATASAARACDDIESGTRHVLGGQEVPYYVTDEGVDLRQLLYAMTRGAALVHARSTLLSDRTLLGSNDVVPGQPYREVEHAWDVAFGAFGAAPDDLLRGAAAVQDEPLLDRDGDIFIDARDEMSVGATTMASSLDVRACTETTLMVDALAPAHEGRRLLATLDGPLDDSPSRRDAILAARDAWLAAWDRIWAVTIIRDTGRVLAVMDEALGNDPDYKVQSHARQWARLRGRLQVMQFGGLLATEAGRVEALLDLVGQGPALDVPGMTAQRMDVEAVRQSLVDVYGVDPIEVAGGDCGW